MPAVRKIVRDAARDNYRFSSIVMGIVKSAPFQMQKVAGNDEQVTVRTRAAASATGDTSSNGRSHPVQEEQIMFITEKHLSRRTFLRGAGVAVAAVAGRDDSGMRPRWRKRPRSRRRTWDSSIFRTARSWINGRRRPKARLSNCRRSSSRSSHSRSS